MRVDELIRWQFVGKKLMALSFGANDGEGTRAVKFGQPIKNVWLSTDEDRDPILRVELEDGSETEFYDNEDVTLL